VTVDVAVYKKGLARPTGKRKICAFYISPFNGLIILGGAGAICMIIGPNAPIVVEPLRSSFFDHAYDFYKPDPSKDFHCRKRGNFIIIFLCFRI